MNRTEANAVFRSGEEDIQTAEAVTHVVFLVNLNGTREYTMPIETFDEVEDAPVRLNARNEATRAKKRSTPEDSDVLAGDALEEGRVRQVVQRDRRNLLYGLRQRRVALSSMSQSRSSSTFNGEERWYK